MLEAVGEAEVSRSVYDEKFVIKGDSLLYPFGLSDMYIWTGPYQEFAE